MISDFPIDIIIRLAELKFFLLLPGRKLAKSGSSKKKIQFCQSYSYVNRKVWYHQIWIPNNLDFMVLILMYVPTSFVCIVFKSEVNGVKVHLDLDIQFWSRKYFCWNEKPCICKAFGKVIYAKYSKHWPYTVAHTIDCVCNKMLNHGLNHGLSILLFIYSANLILMLK